MAQNGFEQRLNIFLLILFPTNLYPCSTEPLFAMYSDIQHCRAKLAQLLDEKYWNPLKEKVTYEYETSMDYLRAQEKQVKLQMTDILQTQTAFHEMVSSKRNKSAQMSEDDKTLVRHAKVLKVEHDSPDGYYASWYRDGPYVDEVGLDVEFCMESFQKHFEKNPPFRILNGELPLPPVDIKISLALRMIDTKKEDEVQSYRYVLTVHFTPGKNRENKKTEHFVEIQLVDTHLTFPALKYPQNSVEYVFRNSRKVLDGSVRVRSKNNKGYSAFVKKKMHFCL